MILPTTNTAVLLLLILSVLCWGSWANTQKLAGRWRPELYYYDFSFGALVCAVLAAFTLGLLNSRELTFQDNFLITSNHKIVYAAGAGAIFNLGNILLVSAISISGIAVAIPLALGFAMAITVIWSEIDTPQGNFILLGAGVLLVVLAVVMQAAAYSSHVGAKRPATPVRTDARAPRPPRAVSAGKGIALSLVSGIFIAISYLLLDSTRSGENGLAAYGLALLFAGGLFISTLVINPFFMNFPLHGKNVELKAYFNGTKRQHLLGVLGGVLWMAGAISNFAALGTTSSVQPTSAITYLLVQAPALVAFCWGVLAWREFNPSARRVKVLLACMVVLYAAGVGLAAIAPHYSK